MTSEREIERQFVIAIKNIGGMAIKFQSPSFSGMPDRLVLIPNGRASFAEIKRPGAKPRPLQSSRHAMLRSLGFRVHVVDGYESIREVIDDLQTT